jgi:hypothetical protein
MRAPCGPPTCRQRCSVSWTFLLRSLGCGRRVPAAGRPVYGQVVAAGMVVGSLSWSSIDERYPVSSAHDGEQEDRPGREHDHAAEVGVLCRFQAPWLGGGEVGVVDRLVREHEHGAAPCSLERGCEAEGHAGQRVPANPTADGGVPEHQGAGEEGDVLDAVHDVGARGSVVERRHMPDPERAGEHEEGRHVPRSARGWTAGAGEAVLDPAEAPPPRWRQATRDHDGEFAEDQQRSGDHRQEFVLQHVSGEQR